MIQRLDDHADGPRDVAGPPAAEALSRPPAAPHAGRSGGDPERSRLTLGIVPLADCAPIVIARELGFFEREGLDVTISLEGSWSTIRDKVTFGALDGAMMPAPMPIAATLGIAGFDKPIITAISLGLNGNAITISNELHDRLHQERGTGVAAGASENAAIQWARALKRVIAQRSDPLTFAIVFPFSSHHYELRHWLAAGGINPDRDVRVIVVPPPQMVQTLQEGEIDGYIVGAPWNELAVRFAAGRTILTGHDIWNNAPEKVLGVTRDWAMRHPQTHRAMLRALLSAAMWLDEAGHRDEAVQIITQPQYVSVPPLMMQSMTGQVSQGRGEPPLMLPDFNVYYRYAATFPWRSHAIWLITQMLRWGQIDQAIHVRDLAAQAYRPDLYRAAAADLGLPCPTIDEKTEGTHDAPWPLVGGDVTGHEPLMLGPDRFCDGTCFDPARPIDYLKQFDPNTMLIDPGALAAANVNG